MADSFKYFKGLLIQVKCVENGSTISTIDI